jgi:hypothetical protein
LWLVYSTHRQGAATAHAELQLQQAVQINQRRQAVSNLLSESESTAKAEDRAAYRSITVNALSRSDFQVIFLIT